MMSLLDYIPYCFYLKYALSSSVRHWNDIEGRGIQVRVEKLWICFIVWIWVCRKSVTCVFFYWFSMCFLNYYYYFHFVLIFSCSTDSLNNYNDQTLEDTTHLLLVLKTEHFNGGEKAFLICHMLSVFCAKWELRLYRLNQYEEITKSFGVKSKVRQSSQSIALI